MSDDLNRNNVVLAICEIEKRSPLNVINAIERRALNISLRNSNKVHRGIMIQATLLFLLFFGGASTASTSPFRFLPFFTLISGSTSAARDSGTVGGDCGSESTTMASGLAATASTDP